MNSWPGYVAEEYISSIREDMSLIENPTPDIMINTILENANERISGLIFRDANGNAYVWTTASKSWEEGSTRLVRGTIKEHKTYRNVNQTA